MELVEVMAKNVHEVWSQSRLSEGWTYGARRDDEKKTHPCLVPYEELPEIEKDYDRNTAIGTLKLIQALGFDIVAIAFFTGCYRCCYSFVHRNRMAYWQYSYY